MTFSTFPMGRIEMPPHIPAHTHTFGQECVHAYMVTWPNTHTPRHPHMHTHTHLQAYIHAHINAFTHTHTHVHACMQTHKQHINQFILSLFKIPKHTHTQKHTKGIFSQGVFFRLISVFNHPMSQGDCSHAKHQND